MKMFDEQWPSKNCRATKEKLHAIIKVNTLIDPEGYIIMVCTLVVQNKPSHNHETFEIQAGEKGPNMVHNVPSYTIQIKYSSLNRSNFNIRIFFMIMQ
jgi:hypothetical protein